MRAFCLIVDEIGVLGERMARARKKNRKMSRGGRLGLAAFAALLLALGVVMGAAALNASLLRVRRAEVVLTNLPDAFDGATILYASDIDLCGLNDAEKSGELFKELQSLSPDMLILGGDYTSRTLLERLNRPDEGDSITQAQARERTDFFHYIASFEAPLGKYAVASPEDGDTGLLAEQLRECGIRPITRERVAVSVGGDAVWLVGIGADSADLNAAGNAFSRNDCVIAIAYSPSVFPVLLTGEASDGGPWADLILAGHTHGGQIELFGRSLLPLTRVEHQYRTGWTIENGTPILTTEGVGCEGANLRLGTAPEVWLITLRRM